MYPAATLENNTNAFATENSYYNINTADTISVNRIASWSSTTGNNYVNNNGNPPYNTNPYANTSATSAFVYKLNGNTGDKSGLGITLKVMTGDVVNIYAKSFWHNNTGSNPVNSYLINAALNSFLAALAGTPTVAGVHGASASALQSSTATSGGVNTWLSNVPNPSLSSVPKAYINWILFNDQFVPISSNCGYDLVSTSADAVKSHNSAVSITTSGYLYVYCSNESNVDVFFDNLQLIQTRGPLLETTNYYPFGLTMAGISSKALGHGSVENSRKFNGGSELQSKEFADGSGLEAYDTHFRQLDPQLGRWLQIDPKPNYSQSLYLSMNNNPVEYNDLLGDTLVFPGGSEDFIENFYSAYAYLDSHGVGDYLSKLQESTEYITVFEQTNLLEPNTGSSKVIFWNPYAALTMKNGISLSPSTLLDHEAAHVLGELEHKTVSGRDKQYETKEERRVITGREKKVALALGEIKKGQVTRKNHRGDHIRTTGPTTTNSVVEDQIIESLKEQQDVKKLQNQKSQFNNKNHDYCIGCAGSADKSTINKTHENNEN